MISVICILNVTVLKIATKKKCVTHFLKFLEKVEHEKSNSYTFKIYYIPQTAIYDSVIFLPITLRAKYLDKKIAF